MTCIHGNMCPYGNSPREIFCTKNYKINDKFELADLFDKSNLYKDNKVLCDSYCEEYKHQNKEEYTYNDYLYYLEEH